MTPIRPERLPGWTAKGLGKFGVVETRLDTLARPAPLWENLIAGTQALGGNFLKANSDVRVIRGGARAFCIAPAGGYEPSASAYMRPTVKRLAADAEVQGLLFKKLTTTDSPSQRISFSGLLVRAVGLTDELKSWALNVLTVPETPYLYSSVGFDLVSGGTRTVWDKAMELLQPV